MNEPQVTIVVAPRERFSLAARSLQSIYENSDLPFRLVYVDGGSPPRVKRHIERQAEKRGFELIRTEHYVSPNQARNLGLQRVKSKYVVFMDNDVILAPGWLAPLVQCAEETGAAVVSPLNCEGEPVHEVIHFAGGQCHIWVEEKPEGKLRHMVDTILRQGQRLQEVRGQLKRERTEVAEFHCLMARTEIFDRIGPFDEDMLSVRENLDFSMMVAQAGGTVYFEPASIITYLGGCPLKWSDIPFYMVRWSDAWTLASLHHFRDKWDLTEDAFFTWQYKTLGAWRRKVYLVQNTLLRRVPSWRIRIRLEKLVFPIEEALAKAAFGRHARRTARLTPQRQTGFPARD